MTATSSSVATLASRLLRKKHLSDADLDAVQAVAASALTQHQAEASRRKLAGGYFRLGKALVKAKASKELLAEFERLGALLFPAKS